jgi:hypothetical protein
MADKGTGTVFAVDPDQYEGAYARKEQVGGGTIPDPLGGGAAAITPIPKRWNPNTSTWDVIPGP